MKLLHKSNQLAISMLIARIPGMFDVTIESVSASTGSTGSTPLNVILNIIPSNIGSTFSVNNAVVVGLAMSKLDMDVYNN